MSLENDTTVKGLENRAKPETKSLYNELKDDLTKDNKTELAADLKQANETLHKNGFPGLVITGINDQTGKFTTNKGEIDESTLSSRITAARETDQSLKTTAKSGKDADGAQQTWTTTEDPSDGSRVTKRTDGKVTDVELPKYGDVPVRPLHFEYKDGQLVDYTDDHGDRYKKNGDTWEHVDKSGTKIADNKDHKKEVSVDENGVLTEKDGDKGTKKIYPNGRVEVTDTASKTTTVYEKGAKVTTDETGKTTVEYPPDSYRKTLTIERDSQGNATKITNPEGSVLAVYDPEKKEWKDGQGNHLRDVKVDKDGNISITNDNGQTTTTHTDGTEATQGRRAEFSKNKAGEIEHTIKTGDSMWAIAEDNFKRMHPNSKEQPTAKQIEAEIERIARKNKIDRPYNHVRVGTVIKIPKDDEA